MPLLIVWRVRQHNHAMTVDHNTIVRVRTDIRVAAQTGVVRNRATLRAGRALCRGHGHLAPLFRLN